jgi:hypothetical protein
MSDVTLPGRAIDRVRLRLIPFLAFLYFIAYLDRVNVGFAALQMNAALRFSAASTASAPASSSSPTSSSRSPATSRCTGSGRASGSRAS